MPRTRLSRDDRRTQLLDLGARLFAERPYEDVWIEEVAELAGVSRGLLYYYFPTKRAFFAAMLRRESARMLELTTPDPTLDLVQQLSSSVDAYLQYCADHAQGMRMIYNGAESADPDIRAIINEDLVAHVERIIAILSPSAPPSTLLRIALHSWLMFLRASSYGWLESDDVSREEIRDLCTHNLVATVLSLPEHARPPVLP